MTVGKILFLSAAAFVAMRYISWRSRKEQERVAERTSQPIPPPPASVPEPGSAVASDGDVAVTAPEQELQAR